jgi:hypothetical protein
MDMTSVSSSFTIEIKTSALVRIDDFVALPRSARVSSQTFKPFNGVTSSSDDRGRSTVITYDVMGRKSATLDYQRNLVELQEYGLQRLGRTSLNPNFTTNVTEYYAGQTITFTADVNCLPQMTYAWTFTDPAGNSTTASGSPVNKKFFSYGVHNVTLQVSSPGYGTASFTQNICVFLPADVTSFLHVSVSPSSVVDRCSPTDDGKRTFHAFLTGIDTDGLEISYSWARTNINGTFTGSGSGDDDSVTINFPGFGYQVRCIVEISIKADGEAKCNSDPATGTQFNGISYINAPPASCP